MKQPLDYENWIKSLIGKIAEHFNFGGWMIGVEFSDKEKGDSYAETTINSNYQTATIHVYSPAKRDFDAGKMEILLTAMVHELVHIFLDPFHDFASPHLSETTSPFFMNIVEQQTQKLTMVLLKTLPKNLIPPR
jgi:hypothetical protein